ncbi:protein of unknown function [Bartonella clarridgeiae 73]|uniref:Uncharacterized protein n=1 Tax=Bartonella clarridgeiae (strain CCUG 45776 / CIP 104772 / 73) TaxID=696125 RepID=E6YIS2_BARC7|nr:protein of unknown function [Bartonella clarridgeiae 73]
MQFSRTINIIHEYIMTVLFEKDVSSFKHEPCKGQTNLYKLTSFTTFMIVSMSL